MKPLKTAGTCAGIAIGSALGGTVSFVGKMANKPGIDELGENIMDSAILSGEIAGQALSGTADIIAGAVRKDRRALHSGSRELKRAGGRLLGNVVDNVKLVAGQAAEVATGLRDGDREKIVEGMKTIGKIAAIELLTVGAVQVEGTKKKERQATPVQVVRIIPQVSMTARVFPEPAEVEAQPSYRNDRGQKGAKKGFWSRLLGR